MSYNGSGTFLINSAGQPVVANTVISATVFNALTSDLATGLSTAITKDGQTTITANIPFGSNKITGLGAGTAATDAANLSQVQSTVAKLVTVTGTDTITGSMSPQLTAYAAGQLFYFVANAANTGPVTINIDSLGAKAITRDGSTALAAGDINSGEVVVVIYDGTRFQMINAANSFGNTTINGTLTVTGNTGLQANVSITSTLSVGGTFAVTGAATLGSTLAVTGKSDLPTVSTASINAAVALITTGTVTNLTASGASIASANIGNLQFTAASIASINAGVAVITNLTATGASIASANVGTAVITAATVTGASIASANVGTAVITTGTVTNLTSTSASVASINAAVALITTGTVTALTATGASVASANVGTAVVTGLTVTNASIASLNAGTATVTTGNLTFSSTAQRITGDMSNATFSSRLAFQSSTTNGNTILGILANGTPADLAGTGVVCNAVSDTTNTQTMSMFVFKNLEASLRSNAAGTGTYLPMTFYTGGSERMRLDTSGNLLVGTATGLAGSRFTVVGGGTQLSGGTTAQEGVRIQRATGYATFTGINNDNNAYNGLQFFTGASAAATIDTSGNVGIGATPSYRLDVQGGTASFTGSSGANAIRVAGAGGSWFWIDNPTTTTMRFSSGATAGTGAMVLDSSGNVGIGTASPGTKLTVSSATNAGISVTDGTVTTIMYNSTGGVGSIGTTSNHPVDFYANNAARMRIDSSGNVGIGGTADAYAKTQIKGNLPASGGTSVSYDTQAVITSSATSSAIMYESFPSVQNASFTLPILYHFIAAQGTKGASATVTNQYGFFAGSSLTGATNNYGFYSDIASGSNRWNFYAAGTAQNYFAGDTGVGATPAANYRFWVKGSDSTSSNAAIGVVNSSNTNMFYLRNDNYFNSGAINNYSVAGTTVVIDSNNFLGKTTSSLRYKKDIVNYDKGLLAISKLRPVYYKSAVEGPNGLDPKQHAGLIAEEIEAEGFEEFLIRDNDGRAESIQYPNMVALLVKAVQELSAKVAALEAK